MPLSSNPQFEVNKRRENEPDHLKELSQSRIDQIRRIIRTNPNVVLVAPGKYELNVKPSIFRQLASALGFKIDKLNSHVRTNVASRQALVERQRLAQLRYDMAHTYPMPPPIHRLFGGGGGSYAYGPTNSYHRFGGGGSYGRFGGFPAYGGGSYGRFGGFPSYGRGGYGRFGGSPYYGGYNRFAYGGRSMRRGGFPNSAPYGPYGGRFRNFNVSLRANRYSGGPYLFGSRQPYYNPGLPWPGRLGGAGNYGTHVAYSGFPAYERDPSGGAWLGNLGRVGGGFKIRMPNSEQYLG